MKFSKAVSDIAKKEEEELDPYFADLISDGQMDELKVAIKIWNTEKRLPVQKRFAMRLNLSLKDAFEEACGNGNIEAIDILINENMAFCSCQNEKRISLKSNCIFLRGIASAILNVQPLTLKYLLESLEVQHHENLKKTLYYHREDFTKKLLVMTTKARNVLFDPEAQDDLCKIFDIIDKRHSRDITESEFFRYVICSDLPPEYAVEYLMKHYKKTKPEIEDLLYSHLLSHGERYGYKVVNTKLLLDYFPIDAVIKSKYGLSDSPLRTMPIYLALKGKKTATIMTLLSRGAKLNNNVIKITKKQRESLYELVFLNFRGAFMEVMQRDEVLPFNTFYQMTKTLKGIGVVSNFNSRIVSEIEEMAKRRAILMSLLAMHEMFSDEELNEKVDIANFPPEIIITMLNPMFGKEIKEEKYVRNVGFMGRTESVFEDNTSAIPYDDSELINSYVSVQTIVSLPLPPPL